MYRIVRKTTVFTIEFAKKNILTIIYIYIINNTLYYIDWYTVENVDLNIIINKSSKNDRKCPAVEHRFYACTYLYYSIGIYLPSNRGNIRKRPLVLN